MTTSEERFRKIVAECGEHFNDYLLIASTPEALFWKTSDESFGVGAAMRYVQHVSNKDLVSDFKPRMEG